MAAAEYADCKLTVKKESESTLSELDPLAKGFVLKTRSGFLTRQNAILRHLGEISPALALTGATAHESAQVDQWLGHVWNEIEVPVQVLLSKSGVCGVELTTADKAVLDNKVRQGLPVSLGVLDSHLEDKTFFVGERVTIADIAICCVVHTLKGMRLLDQTAHPSLYRWFMTVSSQRVMKRVLGNASGAPKATPSTSGGGSVGFKWQRGRVRVKELLAQGEAALGSQVVVKGWIRTSRTADKGKILFVELTDGSTPRGIQLVLSADTTQGTDAVASCGGAGASISVVGNVVQSSGKGQTIEIQAISAEVLGPVYGGENGEIGGKLYPMAKKAHSLEFLRENAHLRPRSKMFSSALRVRHAMAYAVHSFYNERGFVYVHTPLITAADCEGAGEQFLVTTLLPEDGKPKDIPVTKDGHTDWSKDFFGRRCSLTVSGQLNVETHACALSDVYTFGPTFRAENSHTSRHLAEFWMIEPEICFADMWDDMALAEDFIKHCTQYALEHCADDLEYFEEQYPKGEKGLRARLRNVIENDFARISYTEAIELLQSHIASGQVTFENPVEWGADLNSEHERYLSETVRRTRVVWYRE